MAHHVRWACFFVASTTVVVAACISDDPGGATLSSADAGADVEISLDTGTPDAGAGACNLSAPWLAPVLLTTVNSTANDQRPSLSADERVIYFSSRRSEAGTDSSTSRIFAARRVDPTTDSFGTPKPLAEVVNRVSFDNIGSALSNDQQRLYFSATNGSVAFTLFVASHTAVQNLEWPDATLAPVWSNDVGASDVSPFLANDGTLYFARAVAGAYDIFRALPDGQSGFKTPTVVGELTSEVDDSDPTMSPDGLTIYFSSTRPGSLDTDIWSATRTTTSAGFGPPKREAELSSTSRDVPGWISPDGCRFYIVSTRPGGPGGLDVFVASKPK